MIKKINQMISQGQMIQLSEYLQNINPVDISKLLMELSSKDLILTFRLLPKDKAAEAFSYLDKEYQMKIIEKITDSEVEEIIEQLFLDDTVDFIEELPSNVVKKVLRNTSQEKRNLINQFLKYEQYSAGSIMTIEFVELKENMNVKDAIASIRHTKLDKEIIETCFVIDKNRKLKGSISLQDLIVSSDDTSISKLTDTNIVFTTTTEDQEKVATLFKEYDLICMAVVDKEDRLVGIITADDIIDIIEKENTEDFQKMAAMKPSEEPYLKTPVLELAKHRVIWLLVLMISATITGSIIKKFDEVIQSVVILAAFIPMLMDTGGNSGSQSATLVIRGLALGDIQIKDYLKVMWKEFRVGLVVAFVLAVVNFLRIYFLESTDIMVTLTICISLFFTVIIAKVTGSILPIIAKKLKFDPAIMASPLITTIVDTFALIIYFSLARVFLGI
ncbi:magnesium transporter [Paraclostridium ghonii]|uniref:Magnesium transporter MgtE n=1 Tax=Paraclostridium ghonii TaxID=29358 RepID=A0ABU0N3S1_9FIRM|nr:magnesium transporter [Paeniclostridium ghonii]MDQ0557797.1 magnesium transporter [Paeniclostridium ghonii]